MPLSARIKKLLIDLHLYLGVLLCLFFAAWFVSGVAMMYYTTPILQPRERHALAQPIPWKGVKLEAAEAAAKAGWADEPLKEARLGAHLGRPVLRVLPLSHGASWKAVGLDDGKALQVDVASAMRVAGGALGGSWIADGVQGPDNWTQHGALDPHQRAYHFSSSDGSGRTVLVSASTGEPILATGKGFYLLYFFGPIVHYYTLKPFRDCPAFWRNLVDWSSGLGIFMCLLGLILGVWFLRWDKVTTQPKKAVPYNDTWMWLHHAFGMLFGVLTFTFVMSGLFSMNPMKIFPSSSMEQPTAEAFRGQAFRISGLKGFKALARQGSEAFEASFHIFEGRPTAKLWSKGKGVTQTLSLEGRQWAQAPILGRELMERAVERAYPGARLGAMELLPGQDAYYYERPEKRRWKQFPVYRGRVEGAATKTLYIEPYTGEVLLAHGAGSKLRRWLYNGLHSWDFMPVYTRPFWDILVILMSLAGLALSVTGVVLSWRWLAKRLRPAAEMSPSSNLETA